MEDDLAISCRKANEEVPLKTDQQLRKPLGLVEGQIFEKENPSDKLRGVRLFAVFF